MKRPDYIPADYNRIKIVGSLTELFNTPFGDANCILFPRTLTGDFNALSREIAKTGLSKFLKRANAMPPELAAEEAQVKNDMQALKGAFNRLVFGSKVQLRLEKKYKLDREHSVLNFHIDGTSKPKMGRILCNYTAPVTEWIRNEDAVEGKVRGYFEAREGAPVYSFGVGDIWRQSCRSRAMDGFIHRAPESVKDIKRSDPPRLILIGG